jgi:hypothetical protein
VIWCMCRGGELPLWLVWLRLAKWPGPTSSAASSAWEDSGDVGYPLLS